MNDVPLKCCSGCKQWFPANLDNFTSNPNSKDGLYSKCKSCKAKEAKAYRMRQQDIPEGYKRCSACHHVYPATTEHFCHSQRTKDGWYNQCKTCQYAGVKASIARHGGKKRKSPPPQSQLNGHDQVNTSDLQEMESVIIDRCDSCGTMRGNIVGDVDEKTHEKYGKLCATDINLIRISKGDTTRLDNLSAYLKRTRVDKQPEHML